jgi:hypothetical protein
MTKRTITHVHRATSQAYRVVGEIHYCSNNSCHKGDAGVSGFATSRNFAILHIREPIELRPVVSLERAPVSSGW